MKKHANIERSEILDNFIDSIFDEYRKFLEEILDAPVDNIDIGKVIGSDKVNKMNNDNTLEPFVMFTFMLLAILSHIVEYLRDFKPEKFKIFMEIFAFYSNLKSGFIKRGMLKEKL